jgi:hypothetical protein
MPEPVVQTIPYQEQQIRALCLLAAVTWLDRHDENGNVLGVSVAWRKFIAEGRWE